MLDLSRTDVSVAIFPLFCYCGRKSNWVILTTRGFTLWVIQLKGSLELGFIWYICFSLHLTDFMTQRSSLLFRILGKILSIRDNAVQFIIKEDLVLPVRKHFFLAFFLNNTTLQLFQKGKGFVLKSLQPYKFFLTGRESKRVLIFPRQCL